MEHFVTVEPGIRTYVKDINATAFWRYIFLLVCNHTPLRLVLSAGTTSSRLVTPPLAYMH